MDGDRLVVVGLRAEQVRRDALDADGDEVVEAPDLVALAEGVHHRRVRRRRGEADPAHRHEAGRGAERGQRDRGERSGEAVGADPHARRDAGVVAHRDPEPLRRRAGAGDPAHVGADQRRAGGAAERRRRDLRPRRRRAAAARPQARRGRGDERRLRRRIFGETEDARSRRGCCPRPSTARRRRCSSPGRSRGGRRRPSSSGTAGPRTTGISSPVPT